MTLYGSETLRQSVIQNRKILDYICIIHQTQPLFGNICSDEYKTFDALIKLKKEGFIDDVIICEKCGNESIYEFILRKRNLGLNMCKLHDCDYIVPLDADEIYLQESKDFVLSTNHDTYYTAIKTYYCDPSKYYIDNYYVPFCYKIDARVFKDDAKRCIIVDPLRCMDEKIGILIPNQYMHHFSITEESVIIKLSNNIGNLTEDVSDMWNNMLAFIQCEFDGSKAVVFDHTHKLKEIPLIKAKKSPWIIK